jgi:hypothetical protein
VFIEQLFEWIAVICLDRVHTQGTLKGKDILIAMGGYVPNILQQLPLMEKSKAAVFDHFIDYTSTESSGTWPFALIHLIDSYSSTTLSKTVSNRISNHTDFDADTIKKLNLGYHLKKQLMKQENLLWITIMKCGFSQVIYRLDISHVNSLK